MPFHNPYNFVPTPDRGNREKLNNPGSFAGDHDPTQPQYCEDHSRYWADRYTGTISVLLCTKTPLFITDPDSKVWHDVSYRAENRERPHYTYDCLDYIPATALKGMLSSAYEIITNSRYRVFSKKEHSKKLGMRMSVAAGNQLIAGSITIHNGHKSFTYDRNDLPVPPAVEEAYKELIENYQAIHKNETSAERNRYGSHITNPDRIFLRQGNKVYAKIEAGKILALFPVQISRELCAKSPWDCVYDSILPADALEKLSPADRLFGWVSQERSEDAGNNNAWKGKISISDSSKIKLETCGKEGVTFKVLGNPKPAQARFYLGQQDGTPQKNKISKEDASYRGDKKLRGRKVYLHQLTPDYRCDDKNHLNRTISSIIPSGTEVQFKIRVENLTREELGALLTLLSMPEGHYFKLGYAKPLGLGSVSLSIDWNKNKVLQVQTGKRRSDFYKNLDASAPEDPGLCENAVKALIKEYKRAMTAAYTGGAENMTKSNWETLPFINDFLCSMKGFFDSHGNPEPIHYPWNDSGDAGYTWFVNNERLAGNRPQYGYSLPKIGEKLKETR